MEYQRVVDSLTDLEENLSRLKALYEKQLAVALEQEAKEAALAKELADCKEELKSQTERAERADRDKENATSQLEQQIADLEKTLQAERTESRITEDLRVKATEEIDRLTAVNAEEVEALKQDYEKQISAEREACTDAKATLEASITKHREEVEKLEQERDQANKEVNQLKREVENKEVLWKQSVAEVDILKSEIKRNQEFIEELKSRSESSTKESEGLQQQRIHMIDSLRAELDEKTAQLAELRHEVQEGQRLLKVATEEFEDKMKEQQDVYETTKHNLEGARSELEAVKHIVQSQKEHIDFLERVKKQASDDNKNLVEETNAFRKQLDEERSKNKRYLYSQDNMRHKLSSLADLTSTSDLHHGGNMGSSLILDVPTHQPSRLQSQMSRSSSFDDGGGANSVSNLRRSSSEIAKLDPLNAITELKMYMRADVRAFTGKLVTIEEGLTRDMSKTAFIMDDIDHDDSVDAEMREIIKVVLSATLGRLNDAKNVVITSRSNSDTMVSFFEREMDNIKESMSKSMEKSTRRREEAERRVEETRESLNALEEENRSLSGQVREKSARITQLEEMRVEENRKLQALEHDKRKLEEELSTFRQEMKELSTSSNTEVKVDPEVLVKLEKLQERVVTLELEVSTSTRKYTQLQAILDEKETELLKQVSHSTALGKEIASKRNEVDEAVETATRSLRSEVNSLTSEKERLLRLAEAADTRSNTLQESIRSLNLQVTELTISNGKKQNELEHELIVIKQSRMQLEDQVKTLSTQLESEKTQLEAAQKEITSLQQGKTNSEEALKRVKQLQQELVNMTKLRDESESLRQELEMKQIKSDREQLRLNQEIEELKNDRMKFDAERQKLKAELDRSVSSATQASKDAEAVARQLKETSAKLYNLQRAHQESIEIKQSERELVMEEKLKMSTDRLRELELRVKEYEEKNKILDTNLESERSVRRDTEKREERLRKQLDDEINILMTTRKNAEERESFYENMRKMLETRVYELLETLEQERQAKHKAKEDLHSALILQKNLQIELDGMKQMDKLYEAEANEDRRKSTTEMSRYQKQINQLEEENSSLRNRIQVLESQMGHVESNAKKTFDSKLKKIVSRLESQSREREYVDRFRDQNEADIRSTYERKIAALSTELHALRHGVDYVAPVHQFESLTAGKNGIGGGVGGAGAGVGAGIVDHDSDESSGAEHFDVKKELSLLRKAKEKLEIQVDALDHKVGGPRLSNTERHHTRRSQISRQVSRGQMSTTEDSYASSRY
ncbi:hypothetical protein HDU76_006703 [Blyttiomyces sp. JEL0837]|nr:hypothetical protein HDU76_006703 [Blyttiomyces sp. JEL0837]